MKQVWSAAALVRAFVDAVVDAFVRASHGAPSLPSAAAPWDQRWRSALAGPLRSFAVNGFAERSVVEDLVRWSEPALGEPDKLRACFRLDLPVDPDGEVVPDAPFVLRFLLQSPDDPSLLLTAKEVWNTPGRTLEAFGGRSAIRRSRCSPRSDGRRASTPRCERRWRAGGQSVSSSMPPARGPFSARTRQRWRTPASVSSSRPI